MPAPPCPSESELRQYLLGDVIETAAGPLVAHLESCSACLTVIRTLEQADPLLRAKRTLGGPAEHGNSHAIRPIIQSVPTAAQEETGTSNDDVERAIGRPPDATGSVGAAGATTDSGIPSPAAALNLGDILSPPQAADEIGRLGSYRILEVLGQGGMGVVFKAHDPQLDRLVALKAMLPRHAVRDDSKERFLREARAAPAVRHDNIVVIHQVGEDRGIPFFAMEHLQGETLEKRLKREGALPLAEVVRIGVELARALAAAHAKRLVHRDEGEPCWQPGDW